MAAVSQTTLSNAIFWMKNVRISIKISLKFVPKGPINNKPALVQIMAWRRSGDKPLSEPMMVSLLTHICVTRPQWVNNIWMLLYQLTHFSSVCMHIFSSTRPWQNTCTVHCIIFFFVPLCWQCACAMINNDIIVIPRKLTFDLMALDETTDISNTWEITNGLWGLVPRQPEIPFAIRTPFTNRAQLQHQDYDMDKSLHIRQPVECNYSPTP